MAQTMRATLLATATAVSFLDLRASKASSHGAARPGLAARITAVAPITSNRRRSSSPARLILPSFCRPAVEASRGVMPTQEAKVPARAKGFQIGHLESKADAGDWPDPGADPVGAKPSAASRLP